MLILYIFSFDFYIRNFTKTFLFAFLAASEIHCLRKPQVKPLLNLYGCSWQLVHDERGKCLWNIFCAFCHLYNLKAYFDTLIVMIKKRTVPAFNRICPLISGFLKPATLTVQTAIRSPWSRLRIPCIPVTCCILRLQFPGSSPTSLQCRWFHSWTVLPSSWCPPR